MRIRWLESWVSKAQILISDPQSASKTGLNGSTSTHWIDHWIDENMFQEYRLSGDNSTTKRPIKIVHLSCVPIELAESCTWDEIVKSLGIIRIETAAKERFSSLVRDMSLVPQSNICRSPFLRCKAWNTETMTSL